MESGLFYAGADSDLVPGEGIRVRLRISHRDQHVPRHDTPIYSTPLWGHPLPIPSTPSQTTTSTPITAIATMFAQYSPLFTSGFLSDSPTGSRAPSPLHLSSHKSTHDSLPLTVNTAFSDIFAGAQSSRTAEDHEAIFLTFRPHRKQVEEGLSFLSLDLAESQSMRSMSLRRKDTVTTRATTAFGRSEPSSPSHLPISPIA